jgi:hypothetical protein
LAGARRLALERKAQTDGLTIADALHESLKKLASL